MDYDDNDAKEQNLHLAGEGSSKVSPILHPYALPKFDFDDNLQGHLRFDSLVENEVFLGITSQEDNQWIEEYSRGTSAIQFSSSAVESRRKDVWSEATSSESVEMLLKSVGQEERVAEETTVEELFACDKPGSLTNDMDPNLKQCDETDDYVNTDDAPVPDAFQENFDGSKVSSYCEQSHAASTPQSQETPISGGKLDSVVIGDKYSLSAGEKNVDKICDDVNQEPVMLANESFVNDSQEHPSVSKIECENAGSSPNVIANVEECQENPQEVSERCIENVSGLSKNFYNDEPEHINKSKENIMDNPTNSGTAVEACTYSSEKLSDVSNVGPLENPLVEGSILVDDKPTCSPIADCDMQKTEGFNEQRNSEISASLICSKIDQELNDNIHVELLATSPNGECVKREGVEDANTQPDIPGSPKSNMGSHVQNHSFEEAKNGVVSDGQQVISGASMVSFGNNQFELSERSDINIVGKTSIAAGSSAEMPAEDISNKDEAAGKYVPKVHTGDSNDGHQSSPAKISSLVQVGDDIQSSEPDAISMDQDVTSIAAGSSAEMPAEDISNKDEAAGKYVPKVHTGDSNDGHQSSPAKISSLVQVGDYIQSSEPDAISMDQDVTSIAAGSSAEMPAEDISNKDEAAGKYVPKVHTGDSNDGHQSSPAKISSLVQVGDDIQSSEPDAISMDQDVTSIAAGSSAEMPAEDIPNKDEAAGNHVPKVHTGDSNDGHQSSPAKISSLIQVGDEIQSSEPDAIFMDQDVTFNERADARLPLDFRDTNMDVVGALDSQKNVEPSLSAEGCKGVIALTQGSEPNMAVLTDAVAAVEPSKISPPDTLDDVHLPSETDAKAEIVTEDQPMSPTLGVSLQDGNEEKAVGFSSDESSRKGTQEDDCMVDCAVDGQLPVVKRDAVSDGAEKVVHRPDGFCDPPVGNCNASPSEQMAEDSPGDLKCSKTLETISLPCESSAERGNDAEAGGMTGDGVESLNLAVNMSDEQQASVDVAGPSECDTNHVVQSEVGSTSLEKPQIFSVSDTISIELFQTARDKHDAPKDTGYVNVNAPLLDASNDKEGNQLGSSSNATKEEKSFTFEVSANAGPGQTGIQNSNLSKNTKVLDPNKLHEDSLVGQQTPSSAAIEAGSNGNSERKPRRKSAGKETAKKGNNLKETTPRRRSGRVEKSPALLNPPAIGHVTSLEELKPNESVECSNTKPGDIPPIPTSNLLDLNNPSSMFQQSFTDTQQVQLRAQILVYGSLISGMAPEESHMVAAFGQSDDGRRVWEATWHACLERVRGRKSQANNPDTPMQSRPDVGKRDPNEGIKVGSTQNKVLSPLTPKPSKLGISSSVVSPMIPISSPLWNISTPFDRLHTSVMPRNALLDYRPPLSPLLPYQTPRMQNFTGHNPSWLSQSPFPGQWVASSPVTAFGARLSSLPITDAVKLTTVKESGAVVPVDHAAGPSVSSGLSSLSNKKKVTVSSGQPSSDSKSRKRKKVAVSGVVNEMSVSSQAQVASVCTPIAHLPWAPQTEGYNQITFLAQNQTNLATASAVLLTPVSVTSKSNPGSSFPAISPASSDQNVEKIVTREEIVSKIEESKLQAADAAVHAAAAVSHCQDVWSQLEKQKSSGLVSDDEAKLASSAVSIAAAASVAKVAAAAAKIASNVAEQARLMADEVFLSSKTENYDQISMITNANVDPNFEKATPASILKSANISNHPTSIISAAREAARRRIEAASAASKHAENLDAIVKAAELAAEAVSQAGKIVAMGNPLPLRELVEAGPEGYWKTPQSSKQNLEAAASDKDIQNSKHGLSLQEGSQDVAKNQIVIDGISGSTTSHENDKDTARPREGSDFSKTVVVFPEPEFGSVHTSDIDQNMPQSTSGTREENSIKEGWFVEVYKDDNKNKGAWFAANVLTLKDGKAFVCYTEIQSDEGSGKLKEWVPLEAEGTEAPRIRIAHPMTKMQFEGTRKRSRKAFTDYAWCSGDRVDVWVQDGWREAVVLETNKIDVTSINVQFFAQGETSMVKSWHVRPTLIWKDGKWIESPASKGYHSAEGDTPQEKRLKVGKSVVEGQENDKSSNNVDLIESEKHQQSRILPLSGQGSSFDIGKSSKDENKLENTRRAIRGNLQKERPRVVFGVPKPGKKQKFMDVSKHYVAEGSNKNNPPNDSVKHATSLIPQAPGMNGSRNNSKNDAKEKQVAESKSKVLKSRKPPIPSVRTLVQKDKSKSSKPTSRDGVMSSKTIKDSVGVDENLSPPKTNDVIEDPSASALHSDAQKGTLTSKAISQRLNKGKVAAGGSKGTKVEVKEKPASESEPRRSNRRIQPTSRLLEGLQSSLSVSKTPTGSHANQRSHTKIASKGNG